MKITQAKKVGTQKLTGTRQKKVNMEILQPEVREMGICKETMNWKDKERSFSEVADTLRHNIYIWTVSSYLLFS